MSKLYAAYGSNLNFRQMKMRCPKAKLYGVGTLENYELQFRGVPFNSHATVAPKPGVSVPIAVFEIEPSDEKNLDMYEGCGSPVATSAAGRSTDRADRRDFPNYYFKQDVPVSIDGREVSAMAYVMDLSQNFGVPSMAYRQTIREGYADCGFDPAVLDKAIHASIGEYCRAEIDSLCDDGADIQDEMGGMDY